MLKFNRERAKRDFDLQECLVVANWSVNRKLESFLWKGDIVLIVNGSMRESFSSPQDFTDAVRDNYT